MEREKREVQVKLKIPIKVLIVAVVVAIVVGITITKIMLTPGEKTPEVITVSTLQEIINVSELSTYTAVYNGIAQVMNENKPEDTDYYVSYEANVYAGINFDDIQIEVNEEEKKIQIRIPKVSITKVDVDIASMDFIFYNNKANTSTVSQEAYKACLKDAQQESQEQEAIYELARQNACKVLTALVRPIVEQVDAGFQLSVE
ncbi:hypothetical protein B5F12_04270 [Pseudoflavonifractor sp. An176]|uniref:DUF4230 domain-containing protein n=1 Tax=Pseudoflavonifractor sp. An176 TaxID=1965572 RepID=UPI000B3AB6F2|nr:DUF4230 domain-containing protein [Pseudoflavonifractor sp. An176]OUP64869.1 hypothetical protein B5F12_04270 [Pseudoflavonifractor sp. An176]